MLQLSITSYEVACVSPLSVKSLHCRKKGPPAKTIEKAVELIYADGWTHVENFGSYCPECSPSPRNGAGKDV